MDVREFDFALPTTLIAQEPASAPDEARLLILHRHSGDLVHTHIGALATLLDRGDLVVVNDTRVFPARLIGRRVPSGGIVECLLTARIPERATETAPDGRTGETWEALVHPGQKLKPGSRIVFSGAHALHAEVLERRFHGRRLLRLWTEDTGSVDEAVDAIGHVPLPPYIKRQDRPEDRDRYQTIFARHRGSVVAPTAGLHFSPALLDALRARGVEIVTVTLHVGYGTFQPVRVEVVEHHRVEPESYEVGQAAADAINAALRDGRRVLAVGTTTTRALESAAAVSGGRITATRGVTDLFIFPGHRFRVVGALMTNFHLPRSSLLMLVSAFAGRDRVLAAYREAIERQYRFYSYGDAMLIL